MAMVVKGYAQQTTLPAAASSALLINPALLINNVRIFDGLDNRLRRGNLLIVGSKIQQVPPDLIAARPASRVIDGGGRLMRVSCRFSLKRTHMQNVMLTLAWPKFTATSRF